MKLEGLALVTGASRGIGRAIALQLAAGGADVAISFANRPEPAAETVAAIEKLGRRAAAFRCDVMNQADVDALVAGTRSTLGPIDLLAHCGAISNTCSHDELSFDVWAETIDANLHGAFRAVFAVKDEMIQREFGRIVLLSSVAALRPRARQIHYSAAKAGVIALARCCAEAFAPHNVRVNCIAPGLVQTDFAKYLWENPEILKTVTEPAPLKRIGQPHEIAGAAVYLASPASTFMTGQTLVVDGGVTIAW